MNHPDPLSPEERELARLLGRPPSSAPPAAVDEAVLAGARAALQPASVAPAAAPRPVVAPAAPRRRSRLPAVMGLAASLVFAVGIAWQLKPEAPPPAAPVAMQAEVAAEPPADAAPAVADAPAVPPPTEATAQARVAAPSAPPAPARAAPSAKPAPPPPAPPAPMAAPMAMPAPPAPMAAPRMQEQVQDSQAAPPATLDRVEMTGGSADDSRQRSKRSAPGVMRRAEPAPAAYGALAAPDAITLAVDADAALPRRQWLKRIRERRDAGDLDTARASLERYLAHYPEARIPGDLRQLLDP